MEFFILEEKMKTLILFGSPHKNGNTAELLHCFLENLPGEKYVINAYDKNVSPCNDCRYCYKEKKCAQIDDMDEIYNLIECCDNIVIASPMYFASFPSPLKAIVDRLQIYWSSKYIKNEEGPKIKKGAIIVTSGTKWDNMFTPIEEIVKHVFRLLNAEKICSIYAVSTDKNPVKYNSKVLKYCEECSEIFSCVKNGSH
jgi:multimeric flavodoxin WrbA